jgi:hypothetical protein
MVCWIAGFGAAGGTADLYRIAREQAQRQVAARRENIRRAHEWN